MISDILLAVLPSGITAFCFWLLEHRIQKKEDARAREEQERRKKRDEREKLREQNELLILQSVNASIALSEATAKAVQRIPDAHCNGDMHAALEYADKVKHEQREFLTRQGLGSFYD